MRSREAFDHNHTKKCDKIQVRMNHDRIHHRNRKCSGRNNNFIITTIAVLAVVVVTRVVVTK